MDLYCQHCGEPWEYYYVYHEMTDMERRVFNSGRGCPCCYKLDDDATHPVQGHDIKEVAKKPFRSELQAALREVLGSDTDGLAAEMEDAEYLLGSEFWE